MFDGFFLYEMFVPDRVHFVPYIWCALHEYTHGFSPSLYSESTLSRFTMLNVNVMPFCTPALLTAK